MSSSARSTNLRVAGKKSAHFRSVGGGPVPGEHVLDRLIFEKLNGRQVGIHGEVGGSKCHLAVNRGIPVGLHRVAGEGSFNFFVVNRLDVRRNVRGRARL